jgi:hypothetical protein
MREEFSYHRTETGVTIDHVRGVGESVLLPERLEGFSVTALGARAFAPLSGEDDSWYRALRSVGLPPALERVGDYAFYNCVGLEELTLWDRAENWGSGCLMNCRSLARVRLHRTGEDSPTLFYFASELTSELDVSVLGQNGETALRLIFPEYIESYENNDPAHHFDFHLYGIGFPYHTAFRQKKLDLNLYDGAWGEAVSREREDDSLLRLAFYRLRYPRGLSEKARAGYEAHLSAFAGKTLRWLVEGGAAGELSWFLSRFRPGEGELSEALELARRHGATECSALLLEQSRDKKRDRSNRFAL